MHYFIIKISKRLSTTGYNVRKIVTVKEMNRLSPPPIISTSRRQIDEFRNTFQNLNLTLQRLGGFVERFGGIFVSATRRSTCSVASKFMRNCQNPNKLNHAWTNSTHTTRRFTSSHVLHALTISVRAYPYIAFVICV